MSKSRQQKERNRKRCIERRLLPYSELERFEVDYVEKNMNLKARRGRNYNFTEQSGNANALFVFHRNVSAYMQRM